MEDYMKKLICHKRKQRDKLVDRIIFILIVMIVIAGSITAVWDIARLWHLFEWAPVRC